MPPNYEVSIFSCEENAGAFTNRGQGVMVFQWNQHHGADLWSAVWDVTEPDGYRPKRDMRLWVILSLRLCVVLHRPSPPGEPEISEEGKVVV